MVDHAVSNKRKGCCHSLIPLLPPPRKSTSKCQMQMLEYSTLVYCVRKKYAVFLLFFLIIASGQCYLSLCTYWWGLTNSDTEYSCVLSLEGRNLEILAPKPVGYYSLSLSNIMVSTETFNRLWKSWLPALIFHSSILSHVLTISQQFLWRYHLYMFSTLKDVTHPGQEIWNTFRTTRCFLRLFYPILDFLSLPTIFFYPL